MDKRKLIQSNLWHVVQYQGAINFNVFDKLRGNIVIVAYYPKIKISVYIFVAYWLLQNNMNSDQVS